MQSKWWLSFKNYTKECHKIFLNLYSTENTEENETISMLIMSYIIKHTELDHNHSITDLFTDGFYSTDSLIALHTPPNIDKYANQWSFTNKNTTNSNNTITLSDDNPYKDWHPTTGVFISLPMIKICVFIQIAK